MGSDIKIYLREKGSEDWRWLELD